jgi:hypothetical protein
MPKEASYINWGISKTLCNQMHFTTPQRERENWNQMHKQASAIPLSNDIHSRIHEMG